MTMRRGVRLQATPALRGERDGTKMTTETCVGGDELRLCCFNFLLLSKHHYLFIYLFICL